MIQYMRLLEDSVRVTPLFGPLGYPLWILYGCPLYSPLGCPLYSPPRVARALYISAATPHAWKSWILFA